jgi:hypothetical protein
MVHKQDRVLQSFNYRIPYRSGECAKEPRSKLSEVAFANRKSQAVQRIIKLLQFGVPAWKHANNWFLQTLCFGLRVLASGLDTFWIKIILYYQPSF